MRVLRVFGRGCWIVIRLALALFTLSVPIAGVWAGSSLAAYAGGPLWVALVAGLVAFPVLPLLWEAWGAARRRGAASVRPRILTFADRMMMRTLAINMAFLVVLLAFGPKLLFTALTTRGDWIFDGREGEWIERGRSVAFYSADRLQALYASTQDNEYQRDPGQRDDPGDTGAGVVDRTPTPVPQPAPDGQNPVDDGSTRPPAPALDSPADAAAPAGMGPERPSWPLGATMHPLVSQVPAEAEQSWRGVAQFLRRSEPNDTRLVKALHDYIADRIAYDAPNYAAGVYPPQEPDPVFENRIGVCAGYAQLFAAMAEAVGLEAAYVVGTTRHLGHDAAGVSHAWNAVRLDGSWYLLDITWDAGSVDGPVFTKRFGTDYLFVPPEIMRSNHLPEDPRWQLSERPIGIGEFNRQAMMQPSFYRYGLELESPQRSALTVEGSFEARVTNPRGHSILATIQPAGSARSRRQRCEVSRGRSVRIQCGVPGAGHYRVWLFASERPMGEHWSVGGFEVSQQ